MASSVTSTIYWGSGAEGAELLARIVKHCEKHNISLSEFIKSMVEKELNRGTK